MDREVWRATVREVAKESDMTEGLNSNNNNRIQASQENLATQDRQGIFTRCHLTLLAF